MNKFIVDFDMETNGLIMEAKDKKMLSCSLEMDILHSLHLNPNFKVEEVEEYPSHGSKNINITVSTNLSQEEFEEIIKELLDYDFILDLYICKDDRDEEDVDFDDLDVTLLDLDSLVDLDVELEELDFDLWDEYFDKNF